MESCPFPKARWVTILAHDMRRSAGQTPTRDQAQHPRTRTRCPPSPTSTAAPFLLREFFEIGVGPRNDGRHSPALEVPRRASSFPPSARLIHCCVPLPPPTFCHPLCVVEHHSSSHCRGAFHAIPENTTSCWAVNSEKRATRGNSNPLPDTAKAHRRWPMRTAVPSKPPASAGHWGSIIGSDDDDERHHADRNGDGAEEAAHPP